MAAEEIGLTADQVRAVMNGVQQSAPRLWFAAGNLPPGTALHKRLSEMAQELDSIASGLKPTIRFEQDNSAMEYPA